MIKTTIKEKIAAVIQELPDDVTYEEIMRELAYVRMIERGLIDMRNGKTISNQAMKHRIASWRT